jgi:hypothetical protein
MADDTGVQPAEWFRPGHMKAGDGAAGLYWIGDDGRPEAKIHGAWAMDKQLPSIARVFEEEMPYLLYGNAFGTAVTLIDCRVNGSKTNLSVLRDTGLRPRLAIEGLWLESGDLAFTRCDVQLRDQDTWTQWNAFDAKITETENELERDIEIRSNLPNRVTASFEGADLMLLDGSIFRQMTQAPRGWSLESKSTWRLTFEAPVPIDDILRDWIVPLQFLIMSATGRPSAVELFRATNSAWAVPDERHSSDRWVTVRVARPPSTPGKPQQGHDLLHRASDFHLERQLPLALSAVRRHRYPVEHFAALKRPQSGGPLARFVAAAQLVESFDRTLHEDAPKERQGEVVRLIAALLKDGGVPSAYRSYIKNGLKYVYEPNLERRLRRLDREAGDIIGGIAPPTWAADVQALRNVVVHGLKSSEQLTRDVRPMQVATEILMLLFESRWLLEIGFAKKQVRDLVESRVHHWIIEAHIQDNYAALAEVGGAK